MLIYKTKHLLRKFLWGFILCCFWIAGCNATKQQSSSKVSSENQKKEAPNYASLRYWAAHPDKKDPSDRIPANAPDKKTDTLADVFFIHPTTYTQAIQKFGWNAPVTDQKLNQKTDDGSILYQSSVFNRYCRIYAPYYRQAHLKAFFTDDKANAQAALDFAYEDVKKAFEYYLKNENKGRPIIIASHSQGTWHAKRLLQEFFDQKPLQKQLVAAYIIGLPVYENDFSGMHACNDENESGCIVSWRTFETNYDPPYVALEQGKVIVVNPLSWKTDTESVPASDNKGGLLRNFDKLIPALTNAQIHGNILWADKPHFFGSNLIRTKNFHIADYNFYYENIRENVGQRIHTFLQKK